LLLGLGSARPSDSSNAILFHDANGKPPDAILFADREKAAIPGFEFTLYRAYTRKS
jgi:hypothetical protein